ncbi:MAG: hypothetical protein HXS52_13165 [Theionarchaea archaeon]|nr:hypothetical protein [Theionarchaea archaeon]MBU7038875.1 hypothetical protein [Theionarchaea archaeon]
MNHHPLSVCSCEPESSCGKCSIRPHLKCRFNRGDLFHFAGLFLTFALPSSVGMVQSGYTRFILIWIACLLFFFNVWESRILCRHCPFYAEESRILHCNANYGVIKLWKYTPTPISRQEQIQLVAGFILIGAYPFPFLILGNQIILALLALWGLIGFFWTLQKYICSACVNFSCFFNRVDTEVKGQYLHKNPALRDALSQPSSRPD